MSLTPGVAQSKVLHLPQRRLGIAAWIRSVNPAPYAQSCADMIDRIGLGSREEQDLHRLKDYLPSNRRVMTDMLKGSQLRDLLKEQESLETFIGSWNGDREAQIAASRKTESDFPVPIPEGLEYLPYQRAGVEYASSRKYTLIGDEMGLGKTVQAIGVMNLELPEKTVILCPASLKINWSREVKKFSTRDLTVSIANGNVCEQAQVMIVNYDIIDRHCEALRDIDLLVVDEAHYLKNRRAQRSQVSYELIKSAKKALFLSGTPVTSKPVDLYGILLAIDSPIAKGYEERYCAVTLRQQWVRGGNKRLVRDNSGSANLEELSNRLRAELMVRREKKDVLKDLPPKRRQVLAIDVGAGVAGKGAGVWDRYNTSISAIINGERSQLSVEDLGAIAIARKEEATAKVETVCDHVRDMLDDGAEKVVVFAHHIEVLDGIAKGLDDYGVVQVDGRTPAMSRQNLVDSFSITGGPRVFVGGITAAGVGLNLTASSNVVFAEIDWLPATMSQAEDRCHRIGQKDSVLVQHLVLLGGIEERIVRSVVAKQNICDRILA